MNERNYRAALIAAKIDSYLQDYDPYSYGADVGPDRAEFIANTASDLIAGGYLAQDVIDFFRGLELDAEGLELLQEIEKFTGEA